MIYAIVIKRFLDCLIAALALLLLSPIMIVLIFALAIFHKGNPIFQQARPGKHARLFTLYKFKTMSEATDTNGNLLPDMQRLKGLGWWVRKYSLDELPQLWNVLLGDMSLIGPRPLLPEYLPLYSEQQQLRHTVRPGITGWAQVNGRNAISWQQKFEYDVWYVQHLSFKTDLKIVFLTLKKVGAAQDVVANAQTTMEKFNGHN
jgi:undecaprenyl phosphate N,N'-diacetylbacillosamine 1-phosphate transferase